VKYQGISASHANIGNKRLFSIKCSTFVLLKHECQCI